jgi:PAS domain-containing protein
MAISAPRGSAATVRPAVDRTYAPRVDVQLHAFPSGDREFADYVEAAWAALTARAALAAPQTPEDLQHAIRARYPAAIVTIQHELARRAEGPDVWYAFRTAAIGIPAIGDTPADDAWAILDDERRFLEVSPALARIAELPARRMVGHRVEEFSNPADPSIREDIARLWTEFRSGGALASTLRFNYADGRPREVAYRLEADSDGPGRHRLSVRVLPATDR